MFRTLFECLMLSLFFFYLDFLSRTFTNHRTAWEEGGHLFISSIPLPPASQTLRHYSRAITAESSPLHFASSRTRAQIANHYPLTTFRSSGCKLYIKRYISVVCSSIRRSCEKMKLLVYKRTRSLHLMTVSFSKENTFLFI